MALKPRESISLDDGKTNIETVDEILETYEIKGLSLEDLQEQYVNMVDDYDEKINDMNEKYEELNSSYSNLEETVSDLRTEIQELQNIRNIPQSQTSPYIIFTIIFIIGIIVAFYIGKYFQNNESQKI